MDKSFIKKSPWDYTTTSGISIHLNLIQNLTRNGLSENIPFPLLCIHIGGKKYGTLYFGSQEEIITFLHLNARDKIGMSREYINIKLPDGMYQASVHSTPWTAVRKAISYELIWDIIYDNGLYTLLPKNLPAPL